MAGSLGYLRFSQPVSVRSLFVQWPAEANAPKALVAGRLGLKSIWNSYSHPFCLPSWLQRGHLDPKQLDSGWVDIAGDPLAQVDAFRPQASGTWMLADQELVFMAAKGLQVGGLQIASAEEVEDEDGQEEAQGLAKLAK